MTVRELIRRLEVINPDAIITLTVDDDDERDGLREIRQFDLVRGSPVNVPGWATIVEMTDR